MADEEEVFECSGGIARVGNLSVSTHMRAFASCSPSTMHLSTSVTAPLGVWNFNSLTRPLPAKITAQFCSWYWPGNQHTHAQATSHYSRWGHPSKTHCMHSQFLLKYSQDSSAKAPLQQSKHMQQSRHTQTEKKLTTGWERVVSWTHKREDALRKLQRKEKRTR